MHGPENPGVRICRWKKRAGHEPERNQEHVHDSVKSLGRLHRPGNEKTESGKAKTHNEERAKTNQDSLGCDVDADERREQEEDKSLQKRERSPAENLSANNAAGGDRRDKDGLEKSFPPVFDDRDGRENGREKHDQDECARIKIFEITHAVRRGANAEGRTDTRANDKPKDQRGEERADNAIALPVKTDNLALPERCSGQ